MEDKCTLYLTSGEKIRITDFFKVSKCDCCNLEQFVKYIKKKSYIYVSSADSDLTKSTYVMCNTIERITK